jgi:NADPH-dependent 2,4-dienoyl-CoA reductase/sulfur reductase-like enzyme
MEDGVPLKRIVVVGASVAGIAAAEALRRQGFDGTLVVAGAEPHVPYDRPPLTKAVLAGEQTPAEIHLRPAEWPVDLDVDLRLGTTAVALDPGARTLELSSGERLGYDGLVLATGATPRVLPGPALQGVFTVRTLDDSLGLRAAIAPGADVVVVGGGVIGAEVAATARRLGARVTILEAEAVPLARSVGTEIGTLLSQVHIDEGVEVRCGVPVAGLEGDGRVARVRMGDDSVIPADVVVIGLGVRPATEWLESSGLALGDGVLCDAFCRTSAPGVVAAGDVARWEHPQLGSVRIEHWENAVTQGRAAAEALLGAAAGPFDPVPYVWSDQYEHKVQVVGRPTGGDALVVVDGSFEDRRFVALYTRDDQVTGAISFNRPAKTMRIRKLLRTGSTVAQVTEALGGSSGAAGPSTSATAA